MDWELLAEKVFYRLSTFLEATALLRKGDGHSQSQTVLELIEKKCMPTCLFRVSLALSPF